MVRYFIMLYPDIEYNEPVYRPPSEAYSLILQATIGCSYNKCTFCGMYKTKRFRIKDFSQFKEEIIRAAALYPHADRIFLADGDAMIIPTTDLVKILRLLYAKFKNLQRISIYVSPQSLEDKSLSELKYLKEEGLGNCYYGIESGDDEVLQMIKKGADSQKITELGHRMVEAGLPVSVTVILGLGGVKRSKQHTLNTAKVINAIQPKWSSALTLMLYQYENLFKRLCKGEWEPISSFQSLEEIKGLVQNINIPTIFRSNHASNYLPIKANLPEDKAQLIGELDAILKSQDASKLRPESWRGL